MAKLKIFNDKVVAKIKRDSFTEFFTIMDTDNTLITIIKNIILSGQTPVAKLTRRFQKYSQSYLDFLAGKVRFYTYRGRVRPYYNYKQGKTNAKKGIGAHSVLGYNKKYDTLVSNKKTGTFGKVDKFEKPYPNKKKSPVNLFLTGEMLNSMYVDRDETRQVVWLGFADKKAKYHNDMGAGKSKVIRRLLPTKKGEKFIPNVDRTIKSLAKLSVMRALEKNKTMMKVNFVITRKR